MSGQADRRDPAQIRRRLEAARQHERELSAALSDNGRQLEALAHELDRAEADAVEPAACYVRGPGKTLGGNPHEVATVGVLRPGAPGVVRVLVELADGRQLALDLQEVDAYKLERRLAWRLSEPAEPAG